MYADESHDIAVASRNEEATHPVTVQMQNEFMLTLSPKEYRDVAGVPGR